MKRLKNQQLQNLYQAVHEGYTHGETIDEILVVVECWGMITFLKLDGRISNQCRSGPMKKLLAEWDMGKRHVKMTDDNYPLLFVNYDYKAA